MAKEILPGQLVAAKTPAGFRLGMVTGRHHSHTHDRVWHTVVLADGDRVRPSASPRDRLMPVRFPGPFASLLDLRPEDAEAVNPRPGDADMEQWVKDQLEWWVKMGDSCRPRCGHC